MNPSEKSANRLINESSPYLLQHAYNPVEWFPWGEEALQKAKKENKLLIISIGYSACHWCHVMEHESFEDSLVAKMMNEDFVSIKVDREERPDVDDVYMTACNLISGRGGWPLNAFALPDGRPIWAGTYFPKEQWLNLLEQFKSLKETDYSKLVESAEKIVAGLAQVDEVVDVSTSVEFSESELNIIGENFIKNIDLKLGGRVGSPKFPMPNNYEFLLKYAYQNPESDALAAVNTTLTKMALGGIYDQIGGGFSRYSVDDKWKVPHFEKMLYDNAQLVSLYSNAYRLSKNPLYRNVVEQSLTFMETYWKDKDGGFYSSFDADSEGKEGKFYVWTKEELSNVIKEDKELDLFTKYYNVTTNGNWEEANILHPDITVDDFAKANNINAKEFDTKLSNWKSALVEVRKKRVYPGLDDKILASWNALLLKGYIDAYKAFGEESYLKSAISIQAFIVSNLKHEKSFQLYRNFKNGKSSINAFLDDYAFTINALIHLYEVTFDEQYLNQAKGFTDYVINHFSQESSAMFNYTSDIDPPLVARKSELSDNVIPGSNSQMARNLHLLGLYLYDNTYSEISKQMLRNMKNTVVNSQQPNFYSNWCNLFYDQVNTPYEVAIVGPDFKEKRDSLMRNYHPNAIFLGGEDEGRLKLLEDKLQEGTTMIYVCQDKICKFPVSEAEKAWKLMSN